MGGGNPDDSDPRADNIDAALADVDPTRRAFIRRMAIGAAVTPLVTSFSMAALDAEPAYAQASNRSISTIRLTR
jgi:hypothetical protein